MYLIYIYIYKYHSLCCIIFFDCGNALHRYDHYPILPTCFGNFFIFGKVRKISENQNFKKCYPAKNNWTEKDPGKITEICYKIT